MDIQLGAAIKRLRTEKNITQEELAAYLGLSGQAVSKWETGVTLPDISLLPGLAVFFGVSIDALFSVNTDDHFERIDHMLEHEVLTEENFMYAQRALEALLREDENNVGALKRLARLHMAGKQRGGLTAAQALRKAIALSPADEELYMLLRQAYGGINYYSRSGNGDFIRYCEPFAQKYPSVKRLQYELFDAYIEMRYFDRAEALLPQLRQLDPGRAELCRGDIALARGSEEAAATVWEEAAGDDPVLLNEAGDRYNRICRYDRAIDLYERAFTAAPHPKDLSSTYALAFLYANLNRPEESIAAWERILTVLAEDWQITEGEVADWPRREIEKLKAKLPQMG